MSVGLAEVGSLDAPAVLLVVAVTLMSSAISGLVASFGWRSAASRDARLALDLEKMGGMDDEIEILRGSLKNRIKRMSERRGLAAKVGMSFTARLPELALSTAVSMASFACVAAFTGNLPAVPLFSLLSLLVGCLLQLAGASYAVWKNGGK